MTGEIERHIENLYEKGQFCEALKGIRDAWPLIEKAPRKMKIIKAWCYYRAKKYEQAMDIATKLGNDVVEAVELKATIYAYAYKNYEKLEELHHRFPGNIAICNAVAISGRDKDCPFSLEYIKSIAKGINDDGTIIVGHVWNNIGRALNAKGTNGNDLTDAILFSHKAMERYGKDNHHHRAALSFWISKYFERTGNMHLAISAAKKSLKLWIKAMSLDPENSSFRKSFEGAEKRLAELLNK